MKRLFSAVVLSICLAVLLCACSADPDVSAVNGAMTAVTDDDGKITGYERRYLNGEGYLSRLDQYDADQEYLSFVLYEYYDDGKLYTETYYRADGIAETRTVYTYDDNGKLYEKSYEYPHGNALTERYNTDGEVTEKFYYDEDAQLSEHDVLEDGRWISYDADGAIKQ